MVASLGLWRRPWTISYADCLTLALGSKGRIIASKVQGSFWRRGASTPFEMPCECWSVATISRRWHWCAWQRKTRLVALDAENHPPTLAALLDGEGRLSTFGKMANRVSAKAKIVWDDDYGMLSEHGAHTRLASLRELVATGPDGQIVLRPGGHYDEVWVNVVLYYTLRELVRVFGTVEKVTAFAGIDWVTSAMPTLKEVDFLWRQIDRRAGEELGEPLEDPE